MLNNVNCAKSSLKKANTGEMLIMLGMLILWGLGAQTPNPKDRGKDEHY